MDSFSLPEEFQNKIVDTPSGPKCICDLCGKKGKIGALSFETISGKPLIICYGCNLEIFAEREGISKTEAEKRRKRMFAVGYLFNEVKMAEYLEQKMKKDFASIDEANVVLERIREAWNSLTTEERKSFEEKKDQELRRIYKEIKVDFSDLKLI